MTMNFDEVRFRASMMGEIMTGVAKGWNVENSLTCKRALVNMYRENKYKRRKDISTKYTEKGISAEEDGITLYSRVKGEYFKKNTERITDKHFTGEYDLFTGESPTNAEEITDIKCSWDLFTFPCFLDSINKDYEYQVQTYMALSGAKKAAIAYCLVNATMDLLDSEKRRTAYKMGIIDQYTEDPDYMEKCKKIERNMIFDIEQFKKEYLGYDFAEKEWVYDIPIKERVFTIEVMRDDAVIEAMQDRVSECRIWMKNNLK